MFFCQVQNFLQYYVSLCLLITSVCVWGYLRFVGVCMLFCVCSLWECMFGVLWQCVCVFFWCPCFCVWSVWEYVFCVLCLPGCMQCLTVYVSYAAVYAVCVCIICSWGPRQTDAGSQLQQRGRFQPIHHLHHLFLLILMLMFGKFHAFSTSRFWWLLQLRFHFGLHLSGDLLHLLFAQLVLRRFVDSKTVTRMTQGPSVNPDARCTLADGFAARILSC